MTDTSNEPRNDSAPAKGWLAVKQQILQDKIKAAQWVIRLITIVFTFVYLLPIFG